MVETLSAFANPRGLTPAHLQENHASSDFEFTAEERREFTDTVSKIAILGDRYSGTQSQQTNR